MYGAHGGDTPVDEGAPLQPLTAYAESKVRSEPELAAPRLRRLLPDLHAQRDRIRRLSAPAARHRAEQPRRLGRHDRPDQDHERRHAVAAPRPHRGHLARHRGAARGAERRSCTRRRSTSAAGRRTTRFESSRRSSARRCPGARSSTRAPAIPTRAATASTSASSRAPSRTSSFLWNARRGAEELYEAYRAADLTSDDFEGDRFVRLRRLRRLLDGGRLDERLRWLVPDRAA